MGPVAWPGKEEQAFPNVPLHVPNEPQKYQRAALISDSRQLGCALQPVNQKTFCTGPSLPGSKVANPSTCRSHRPPSPHPQRLVAPRNLGSPKGAPRVCLGRSPGASWTDFPRALAPQPWTSEHRAPTRAHRHGNCLAPSTVLWAV